MVLATQQTWTLRKFKASLPPFSLPSWCMGLEGMLWLLCVKSGHTQGLEGVMQDMTQSMAKWIITHLLIFGITHSGMRSMWMGRYALKRGFGKNALWKNWDVRIFFWHCIFFFFYNNAGRGNDLNLAFSWKQEGWFHGQWGALEEFGVVT